MNFFLIFTIFIQLSQKQKELEELKTKLYQARQEIKELEREKIGTLAHIEKIDETINLTREYIDRLTAEESQGKLRVQELTREIARLEAKMKKRKDELCDRLFRLYKWTPFYKLELLFSSKSIPEILSTSYYLQILAQNDKKAFFEFKNDWEKYLVDKKLREELLIILEKRKIEKEQELQNLNRERDEKERILNEVAKKEKDKKNLELELKSAQRRLEELVVSLQKKQEKKASSSSYFETNRGRLSWPCEGKVISKFGKVIHPKYNTTTRNNGIDIASRFGENVYAVAPGKVVYAGKFMGYGNLVLLDHLDGYYSLYGHLSEILVKLGEEVNKGRIIGLVGESGSLSGPLLHFELRKNGKSVDPLLYLE